MYTQKPCRIFLQGFLECYVTGVLYSFELIRIKIILKLYVRIYNFSLFSMIEKDTTLVKMKS